MKKLLNITLLLSFILFHLNCSADSQITLGYITDLSGKGAFLGTQSKAGVELAVGELNAKGNNIRIVWGDHKLDTKIAISEAQRMVHLEKVDALLSDFTPTSIAASPVAKKAKKLFVHLSPARSIVESNPYGFRDFLDYEQGCEEIARYWKSKGIKKAGHLKLNLEFGELCLKGSRKVYPDIFVIDYNSGDDLRTAVLLMKKKRVEAFFQTAYEVDMLNRLQGMDEIRYHVPVGVPEPLITDLVIEKQRKNLEGTIAFGFQELDSTFIQKLKEKNPDHSMVNIETAALGYRHIYQIVSVIKSCGLTNTDCQVQKMSSIGPDRLLGFQGWENRIAQYKYRLREWKSGKFVNLHSTFLQ